MDSFLKPALVSSLSLALLTGCQLLPKRKPKPGDSGPPPSGFVEVRPSESLDPTLLRPGADFFRLGPGDELEIEVMGQADTQATTTVGPDGKIYYYILPGIDVWGLTLAETRERISTELKRFVRSDPAVAISLRSVASQRVWVLGRVNTPGIHVLGGPTTLLDAIAQSGGLATAGSGPAARGGAASAAASSGGGPETADLARAFVIRQGRMLPVDFHKLLREGDVTQNIYLQPDDFIFLPGLRSSEVHVLGAVAYPQSTRISGSLTLAQAVALAGSTAPDAYISHVAILRGSLAEPKMGIVDLGEIVHGRAADVRLEPGDIVYVPYTPYRTLNRYANLVLDTFARTVGVNLGSKAAGGENASVSVNVSSP